MRHTLLYIIGITVAALLLLGGCTTSDERRRMAALMAEADSMNRNYVTFTTDSVMLRVAHFYDRHGSPNEQLRAHYLLGCTYRDLGEAPQALEEYQNAIDRADTTASDCDYMQLGKVYGQMAEMYHKQNLPEDELYARQQFIKYAQIAKDTLVYIREIELLIKPYFLMGDTITMMRILENSQELYRKHGYPQKAIAANGLTIHYLIEKGQLAKALELMVQYENESGLFDNKGFIKYDRISYYYTKGLYFLKTHQLDSAEYYMRLLLSLKKDNNAYRGMMAVYEQRHQADSVVKYAHLFEEAIDTLNNRQRTATVHQMAKLYNYHRFQKQADAAILATAQTRLVYGTALAVMALCLVVFLFLFWRNRQKHREAQHNYENNLLLLDKANRELSELSTYKNEFARLINEKTEEIRSLTETIHSYEQGFADRQSIIEKTEIYELFRKAAIKGIQPTAKDWSVLYSTVNHLMPNFHHFILANSSKLNEKKTMTCYLVRIGIRPKAISEMVSVNPSYVTQMRTNMLRDIFGREGKPEEFDRELMAIC